MNIICREMQIGDYDAVSTLWHDTEGMRLRDADSRENIEAYLNRNPGLSFVVEANLNVVGAVLVGTDGRRGYLQHLAVKSDYRGKGLGQTLVKFAIEALSKQGIDKTHLFVGNENISAQRFYETKGWIARDEVRMFSFNSSNVENV